VDEKGGINMDLALYLGCTVPTYGYDYELSIRKVLPKFDVNLIDLPKAACCGLPLADIDSLGWLVMSARNIAFAEEKKLDLLALCNGCFLSLEETQHFLSEDPDLKDQVNQILAEEDLEFKGTQKNYLVLTIFHDIIGLEKIKQVVTKPLTGLKIATHYGCHAIRPSKLPGRPDDSETPMKLERILEALGADTMDYPERLACCGTKEYAYDPEITLKLGYSKLKAIKEYGFDAMATICPLCQYVYDYSQGSMETTFNTKIQVPVLYITQWMGLAMEMDPESDLGLEFMIHTSPVEPILEKLQI
jgi:heterodisulfide reductase subunit B